MAAQRDELEALEVELAATVALVNGAHNDCWRQRHGRHLAALRLAILEARQRVGALP